MRLARLLILKSLAETIFISALAVSHYLGAAPPVYDGWSEMTERGVAGWVVSRVETDLRPEIYLYVDDALSAVGAADLARPDVVAAGRARNERCGFDFRLPPLGGGAHEARVYIVHRNAGTTGRKTLIPVGPPLRFTVDGAGRIVSEDADAR